MSFSQAVFSVGAQDDQSSPVLTISGLIADQILDALVLALETRGQSAGHVCEYLCRTKAVMHDTPR
ncbi:MAG: hypothetical protein JJU15_12125 [Pararhodobacter sp.]|nr:hypothetical protein [Pararhodobacter sp.]